MKNLTVVCMLASVLASLVLAQDTRPAATQPADQGNIIYGSMTLTAGSGQWRACYNSANARVLEANKDAIWFWMGSCVCRYNIKTSSIDAQTSVLTHCGLRQYACTALADDGRFAVCGYGIYLWTPGKGWSRPPLPIDLGYGVANPVGLGFDPGGNMWAFGFKKAYLWKDGLWEQSIEGPAISPGSGRLFRVGDGWLDMAEIELGILGRQCLARRIDNADDLNREVAAWKAARNEAGTKVNWQFTTADARIKLRRLYPSIE